MGGGGGEGVKFYVLCFIFFYRNSLNQIEVGVGKGR